MVKSLSFRIQLWYGVLLALVLLGFTGFVYARMRIQRFRNIDIELEGVAESLVAVLKSVPPEDLELGAGFPENSPLENNASTVRLTQRPPAEWDDPYEFGPGPPDFGPPGHGPPGPPRGPVPRPFMGWREKMELPIGFQERNWNARPYFICWQGEELIAASGQPPRPEQLYFPSSFAEEQHYFYSLREMRNVVVRGPKNTFVAVGRSVDAELGDLNRWLILLLSTSAVIFVLGTTGGAWLTKRALTPISAMSQTAAGISIENLSQRIDTTQIDTEMSTLAETLNRTFDRLEHAFQRQATFTADASHELRTPLTIILGHLERILSREKLSADASEALQACFRAARRMKSLIEQLLFLARADAGKTTVQQETCDFRGVVEEVVELLKPLAENKNIQVQMDLSPVDIQGDPQLLSRIVTNLVSNAISHHHGTGEVIVRLLEESGTAVLKVIDDGPGISAEGQQQLFQRFYRADQARARTSGGTGLGLAIVQAVVEQHGGEILCDSVEGKGTTFTVRLPGATRQTAES